MCATFSCSRFSLVRNIRPDPQSVQKARCFLSSRLLWQDRHKLCMLLGVFVLNFVLFMFFIHLRPDSRQVKNDLDGILFRQ